MNLRKLLTDLGASVGRQAVTLLRGAVLIPLITKLIGTDSYGLWASLLGLAGIAAALGSLDLSGSLVRYTPRESTVGQTLVDLLSLVTVAGLLTAGFLAAAEVTFGIFPGNASRFAYPTVALVFVKSLDVVVRNYPQALDHVKLYETLNTAQLLCELVVLGGVLFFTRDVAAGLWATAGVTFVIDIGTLVYYFPTEAPLPDPGNFRQYLRFSLPMVVQTVSSRTIRHADKYLLLVLVSPAAAGVYAVCTEVGKIVEDFTQVSNPTLFPKVVRAWEADDHESLAALYTGVFRVFTLLGLPAVAGLWVLARPLLTTLTTQAVVEQGMLLLPLAALAFLITGFNSPLLFIFNAAERNELLSYSYLTAAAVNLALNLALIPRFGLFGAITATGVSYALITVYMFYWTRRRVRYRLSLGTLVRSLAATGVMTVALVEFPATLSFPLQLVLYPVVGIAVYLPTVFLLGESNRAELGRAWELLRSADQPGQ